MVFKQKKDLIIAAKNVQRNSGSCLQSQWLSSIRAFYLAVHASSDTRDCFPDYLKSLKRVTEMFMDHER